MSNILTTAEVASAINVDSDYPVADLEALAVLATSFILQKTGYDFSQDNPIHPLAVSCAKAYVRQVHYGASEFSKEHDYSFGITSLLEDLKDIVRQKEVG